MYIHRGSGFGKSTIGGQFSRIFISPYPTRFFVTFINVAQPADVNQEWKS